MAINRCRSDTLGYQLEPACGYIYFPLTGDGGGELGGGYLGNCELGGVGDFEASSCGGGVGHYSHNASLLYVSAVALANAVLASLAKRSHRWATSFDGGIE